MSYRSTDRWDKYIEKWGKYIVYLSLGTPAYVGSTNMLLGIYFLEILPYYYYYATKTWRVLFIYFIYFFKYVI